MNGAPLPDSKEAGLQAVLAYHRLSSLDPHRPPAAPARLERASEPIPFRRYSGAPPIPLPPAAAVAPGDCFDLAGLGRWLDDAIGLAGWKRAGEAAFGLRRVPSAGNLHPTEAYVLVSGTAIAGLAPGVYHYSSFDHALERRREFPPGEPGLFVALTTIYWRTAWKYGERAFRLCQLDAGHAAASLAAAGALAGWSIVPVGVGDQALEALLGCGQTEGPEAEHGLLLFELRHRSGAGEGWKISSRLPTCSVPSGLPLLGSPSPASRSHREWPGIARVHLATTLGPAAAFPLSAEGPAGRSGVAPFPVWPREVLRRRRSTALFDPDLALPVDELRSLLAPVAAPAAWLFPFREEIGVLLFIHRVDGLPQGLYLLAEEDGSHRALCSALRPDFGGETANADAAGLPLVLLATGDGRAAASSLAGGQEAAGAASFTVVLVGRLAGLMVARGAWAYRAVHWQAGEIGHRLCLAAAAAGLGATGLSGFHDDRLAALLGLRGDTWRALYLTAVGPKAGPDPELETPTVHRERGLDPRAPSRGGYG